MTLSDGTLYYVSRGDIVAAMNPANGQNIWKYSAGEYALYPPSIAGNVLYFGKADGSFFALDAKSGALIWWVSTGEITTRPIVYDNAIYFGCIDGTLYMLK